LGVDELSKAGPAFIDGVLVDGAARAIAAKNMACVKDILGFER
jgi:hypothetical protein